MSLLLIGSGLVFLVLLTLFLSFLFRRVVSTNEVHIVQSSGKTTSYGKDTANGNSYYEFPSFLPFIGVTKIMLPVSNFDIDLAGYEAYDKGRLPFVVDIKAFFRISESDVAAQRVASFKELTEQLTAVVQGAVRAILSGSDIEEIMQGRSKFGNAFTKEVEDELKNWGVSPVKNIELMDIRDSNGSKVIHNIMEKKKSFIEMQSRSEVASNIRQSKIAELEAQKEVDLKNQETLELVGLRTAETHRRVRVAKEEAEQLVKEQERTTKQKEMSVLQVHHVQTANINREVEIVKANKDKEMLILNAEGKRASTLILAEGELEMKKKEAQAIEAVGSAQAEASKAMQLAPVQAQITLAKEIGGNENYQKYLITIEQIKANQQVGIEQAKALEKASIKIISNTGEPVSGLNSARELFSSSGGTKVAAMLESIAQSDIGRSALKTLGVSGE